MVAACYNAEEYRQKLQHPSQLSVLLYHSKNIVNFQWVMTIHPHTLLWMKQIQWQMFSREMQAAALLLKVSLILIFTVRASKWQIQGVRYWSTGSPPNSKMYNELLSTFTERITTVICIIKVWRPIFSLILFVYLNSQSESWPKIWEIPASLKKVAQKVAASTIDIMCCVKQTTY